jgi:SAM-dependent methyltransferase
MARSDSGRRLRKQGARALALAGAAVGELARRIDGAGAALEGDRIVEWSFCVSRLADGPGRTLDFGADVGFLSLAAAQRGHEVVALDRMPASAPFGHDSVRFVQADILDRPFVGETFNQVVNCSSVEHVGLPGRYGSSHAPDGDLEAMAILRDLLRPSGRMLLTVPVGRDSVWLPFHRIYGEERLPRLLEGYEVGEEQFWRKDTGAAWTRRARDDALRTKGSESYYALGLFVLTRP